MHNHRHHLVSSSMSENKIYEKKSIDFHIRILLKKKDIKKLGILLKFLNFNDVELP